MNDKLHATIRSDLRKTDTEVLWIEVCPLRSKRSIFIAGVYRPPSSTTQDEAGIVKNIEKAYSSNKKMILLGDFNIDLVKGVTRPVSGTCLDHIWTSHPKRMVCVQTKDIGMSDHLPTMAVRRYKGYASQSKNLSNAFAYRDTRHLDEQIFVKDLIEAP